MLSEPGEELLWADDGPAAFRLPAPLFPPFASAGPRPRPALLAKHPAPPLDAMRGLLAVHEDEDEDDEDAVPWLHFPAVGLDDGGGHGGVPLPPEYCSSPALLPGYSAAAAGRDAGDAPASASHGGAVAKQQQPRPGGGEGVMNFTFFSRPLHRPPPPPVESMSTAAVTTSRLRSTPLFSEQRMAWLQPPPKVTPPAAAAPAPAPAPLRHPEPAAPSTRLQPEARAPEPPAPATATTSSVCSDNGDRSQLKRSSHQAAAEWSLSQDDEDLDDEPGGLRRSSRSTKRGRTAEVHNMSERRRRDRINEKMRALQELIPNCNKIDKASMLEEAIEYLKTLQLQVQMMSSMGPAAAAGLCVPPMLAMQMPPMGMGMGMGMAHFHHHHLGAMGFGMGGAFDPRLAQFPCGPMPASFPFPGAGHAMPPFPQTAAAGAHFVVNNAGGGGGAQAEQTPGDVHPAAPP